MIDFNKTIFENSRDNILVCAHRGVSGGNIPCNTIAAFNAALMQHADIIELDVAVSADGKHFVFHPGMEKAHLLTRRFIRTSKASTVEKFSFYNQDNTKTQFRVHTLEDVLLFLKGKCYINVDKFWTDIEGISEIIRKCGVEKQVIVKTDTDASTLKKIREFAPDFMFMPIIRKDDGIIDKLIADGVNCIGAEVLFSDESSPLCSDEFIKSMHEKGLIVFGNAEVYNYKDVISAGRNDDTSISVNPDEGWGWLADKGFDIIQTDWCGMVKEYLWNRNK